MKKKGLYTIGVVARMYDIHPQTLRLYEREGLLKPSRTEGNTRLYSEEDLERLEFILFLTRELGVNLAGVDIILNMKEQLEELQKQIDQLFEFIQTELSKVYEGEDLRKAIVSVPKRKVMKLDDIIPSKKAGR
ncbi:MerR family transcriptional regulator/heat shock protein HspR [Hydrogenivirga caldilitoris]|uniref:MerR family transcriptional regulator/heat shock protein HspR n=1 Tax=Hydrogenivirga caldilitoris TaxID=246264 RepID=A0A497XPW1_9AQUI|nr:helix-turn-helix transcriptional regulator [Hydrogenivirga caldilitoris]RLJ70995.1 MerR family transcriptional regulator/heat shock protein HspR [Hydrogenivirga caldilitoris]